MSAALVYCLSVLIYYLHIFLFIFFCYTLRYNGLYNVHACICRGLPVMWCVLYADLNIWVIHLTVYPHIAIIPLCDVMTKLIYLYIVWWCQCVSVWRVLCFCEKLNVECVYWFSSQLCQTGALWTRAQIFCLYRPRALYNIDRRVYQDRILGVIITCAGVRADEFYQSDFHLEPRKQCAKMEFSGGQDTYKKSENAIRWSIKCLCYWLHNVANKHLPNTTVLHWKKHAIIVIVYMYIKGGSRNNFGKAYLENKKN